MIGQGMTRDMICTPCVAMHWDTDSRHLAMHLHMFVFRITSNCINSGCRNQLKSGSQARPSTSWTNNMVLYVSLRFILIWTTSADVWFLTSSKHVSNYTGWWFHTPAFSDDSSVGRRIRCKIHTGLCNSARLQCWLRRKFHSRRCRMRLWQTQRTFSDNLR